MCDRIGLKPKDIDLLVTNQPNRVFLRNWREALELPRERHATPLTSAATCSLQASPSTSIAPSPKGRLKKGDLVMMAAFAHAGDFAGAAAIRWGGRP